MQVGIPTEVKDDENRVGLTPASVAELVAHDHDVIVQSGAGTGSGFSDEEYLAAGAKIAPGAEEVFGDAELIVKVKEPQAEERARLGPHHTLFTFLHLAPDPEQADDLISSGSTAIAYESVVGRDGDLPLLKPMSQVAGRMAIQAGAQSLEAIKGGAGVLLGGVPGVPGARVTVIGGGVVGRNAVEMAVGMGAEVTVLDRDNNVLEVLEDRYGPALRTVYANRATTEEAVLDADLVVGAVLVRGARAPKLVTSDMVTAMRTGAVIVDVAIDQGGCVETARPTTHHDPTYVVDGVVHYCVANMPGAVPRTSTFALNNATLPYVIRLADEGTLAALRLDQGLRAGLTVHRGSITEPAVADALGRPYVAPEKALA
jgi:alanine dehydrogenase